MLFTIDSDKRKLNHPTDDLMRRVADQDNGAFAELYELTSNTVYCYLLSIVADRRLAEDLMQDTYLSIRKSIVHYIPKNKPMAWIFTIARNLAYMELRRRGFHPETELESIQELSEADSVSSVLDSMILQKALQLLGEEERQIVLLHAVSGYKFRQIAAYTGIPLGTALSTYNRAMKKLRKSLNEEG